MQLNNDSFMYLIAAGFAVVMGLILTLIYFYVKNRNTNLSYEEQLKDILEDEYEEKIDSKVSFARRWNNYWGAIFKEVGFTRYSELDNNAGRDVIVLGFTLTIILSVVFQNPIVAIILTGVVIALLGYLIKLKINRKATEINNQLPGFLFALKANIQGNETPERAIIKITDGMSSPLYDDLIIVKKRLLANTSFREALREMSAKTASRDLKFLAACLIQASETGQTSIEGQLTKIQEVLDSRRKVNDEIARAVRSAMPAIGISATVTPATFFIIYITNPTAQEFWFVEPLSWVALIAVGVLYAVGLWMSKRMVDNVKNI